ncbi:uncharacterized protein LOC125050590 isoform X1 [Pieris napi]|uniref:uncharacterized protein LOC125050590 isoform X1 n=2 Tax=Pieris napi TaxID=78633 RepID=UPI001FB8923E|nr:uncharacterized protein LOC125050590 isoform X1 [Pieris napi]
MLISQTSDGKENTEGHVRRCYETANELLEIMTNNSQFTSSDETLTASDLVILYKNLDVGTRLMTEVKHSQTKPSNQYVETIIYDHDSDESDVGEIYSTEDIRNIMMINKERIDLFNNTASFEKTLCQKLGNLAMNSNKLGSTYDKHFLFKDPYIKEQLNSFMPAMTDKDVLPSSLLDYICCRRLEDNSNFYMDNIIRYVQHTIEQLKRISNGDYLTERAKEKWRQAEPTDVFHDNGSKKSMLANSVSIPLHMERKSSRIKSTWHDIVHSEVDIRSLSKLLEKKIVIEIPRLLCGTYKLFTKRCNDNLIISCKKEVNSLNRTPSRVDVVLNIKKSESSLLISKLNSIKITQPVPQQSIQDCLSTPIPSITYDPMDNRKSDLQIDTPKVEEFNECETTSDLAYSTYEYSILTNRSPDTCDDSFIGVDTDNSSASFAFSKSHGYNDSLFTYPNIVNVKSYSDEQTEANFSLMSPDALCYTVQRLNMNSPVPEEIEFNHKKKKSPTRIRIKSPYENSSHVMEEKKRKRLLEIRERREIKKKSLSDNCKINKNKYAKGVMAQASSSVTKLSITNKSFYNSIYGQSLNESKHSKKERKPSNTDLKIVVELENCEDEIRKKSPRSPRNKEKYINHSYYLDDADTEVMHHQNKLKLKQNVEDVCTASSSEVSEDLRSSLNLLKGISFDNPSHPVSPISRDSQKFSPRQDDVISEKSSPLLNVTENQNVISSNTPKDSLDTLENHKGKDTVLPVQCRKSIDKIYDLMKKLGKLDTSSSNNKIPECDEFEVPVDSKQIGSSVHPSDSGTSLKHHLVSSNPSCFSFEKVYLDSPVKKNIHRKSEIPIATIPKTSTKLQPSCDDKQKKDRRKITSPVTKISENPLKAISQLLRDFESVKINRPRTDSEPKSKRYDTDKKHSSRQVTFRKPLQQEPNLKPGEPSSRGSTPKNKKSRVNTLTHVGRSQYHSKSSVEEKPVDKLNRRKITDIIDEVKEARGEAVRGPPKSRLDSLAQPRKYNQPSNEQPNRNKYTVQRPQRSTNTITHPERRDSLNVKIRQKRTEISGSQKYHSTVPPPLGIKRSESISPDRIRKRSPVSATGPSYKSNVPEAPETLLKKMVAVESYVNNHYGRGSPTRELKGFSGAQKSRVPLVPIDLDMGSMTSSRTAEESTVLGKKLHKMIDTMISSATAPGLTSLCEKKETSESSESMNDAFVDTIEHYEELISNTDFPIDVFGDKSITTAVATLSKDSESVLSKNIDFNVITYDIQPFNSLTELARLENALYRRLSAGAFQKRLRLKNLTLTPKHSLQQILVLQSGDVGSLVVKSTLSQNVLGKTSSKIKEMAETKKLTESQSHVDWTFAKFPTQVSTVAYSVPNTAGEVNSVKTDSEKDTDVCIVTTDELNCCNSSSEQSQGYKAPKSDTACPKSKVKEKKKVEEEEQRFEHDITQHPLSNITMTQHTNILRKEEKESGIVDTHKNEESQRIEKTSQKSCVVSNSSMLENKTSKVDDSTSLDILVGLLNEIRNITTCQTHLTENKTDDIVCDDLNELEVILKRAEFKEYSVDVSPINALSTNSLENFQQQNLCYLYKTNYHILNDEVVLRSPLLVDKEVNVNVPEITYKNTVTDVQSKFFPITVHHSTNVTSSLIGVISKPSEQSMYLFSDYNTLYSNTSFNKIIELPIIETTKPCNHVLAADWCGNCNTIVKEKKINKVNGHRQNPHFDPIVRLKRDILVTVYSILVMTVFAALSFSEVFYRM